MFWGSAAQRGCVGLVRSLTASKCPLHTARLFSISAPSKCPTHEDPNRPLRRWTLEVSPFSTVRAQLGCNISVRPLDPHAYPEADRAFLTAHGTDSEQGAGLDHLHVRYDDRSKELFISAERVNSSVSVDVAAPLKSNLFITTQGKGSVTVKKMECDVCKVQTEEGDCLLHSVRDVGSGSFGSCGLDGVASMDQIGEFAGRVNILGSGHIIPVGVAAAVAMEGRSWSAVFSHQVEIRSHGGHVTGAGTIHGNVDISTCGDGAVDVKKLQGTKMNVSTERGPLKVKAIYAESSCVSSCSGRVELGHVHGNATVKNVSGDTVIDGSNSFLKISSHCGGIDVYVGDGASAELHSQEGGVCVRVPSSLKAGVELCGESVEISPEVVLHGVENNTTGVQTTVTGYMNGESPVDRCIKAQADRGSVRLKTQSWFESLKLGG